MSVAFWASASASVLLIGCSVLTPLDDLSGEVNAASVAASGGAAGSGGLGAGGGAGPAAGGGEAGAGGMTAKVILGEVPGADVTGVTSDTMVEGAAPTFNYGVTASLKSEGDPLSTILLRFALDTAPLGSTIVSAELHIWTTDNPLDATVELFEVLEDWEEGANDAAAGVSNYTIRSSPDVPWTTPGVGPGSRSTTPLASFVPLDVYSEYVLSLPTAVIEGWRDAPASNHGIAFVTKTSTSAVEIGSHEHPLDTLRPWLAITHRP